MIAYPDRIRVPDKSVKALTRDNIVDVVQMMLLQQQSGAPPMQYLVQAFERAEVEAGGRRVRQDSALVATVEHARQKVATLFATAMMEADMFPTSKCVAPPPSHMLRLAARLVPDDANVVVHVCACVCVCCGGQG